MKQMSTLVLSIVFAFFIAPAGAVEDLVESVRTGCEKELTTHCAKVKPGEGRVLACLYAHGDKLSGGCEYALYDAAAQLERFISTLTYLANECEADLDKHCAKVAMGEGRLARCLLDNKDKLSARCGRAVDVTELKVE